MTCEVEILTETEAARGWSFDAVATDATGVAHRFHVDLSWADYNLWSPTGSDIPASVARAVLRFLLSDHPPAELRSSFDASLARRLRPEADEVIPTLIE